jgi:hypothetical protein
MCPIASLLSPGVYLPNSPEVYGALVVIGVPFGGHSVRAECRRCPGTPDSEECLAVLKPFGEGKDCTVSTPPRAPLHGLANRYEHPSAFPVSRWSLSPVAE